ncbi:MAG: T9SS type A sorting domain-containing protein [Bacteroidales bacterium]
MTAVLTSLAGVTYGYFPARLAPDPVFLPALLDSIVGCRWDSAHSEWMIKDDSRKWIYDYDEKGVLLSEIESRYRSKNNQWERLAQSLYTHDSLGNLIQEKTFNWDEIEANWISENNHSYSYDSSGYLIEEYREDWDAEAEQWFNGDRNEYIYDNAGNRNVERSYNWDQDRQVWMKNELRQYTFDSTGFLIEEQTCYGDWDLNTWIKSDLIRHFYDSTGVPTETQYFGWNPDRNEWYASSILRYAYDDGNKINEIISWWWEENNDWVPESQNIYTYNVSGKLTGEYYCYWDRLDEEWEWSQYQQYTYDPSGNLTGEIFYNWSDETKDWQPVGITTHAARQAGGSYFYEYNSYGYQSAHEWKDYDWELGEWVSYVKNICYWSFLRDSMLQDQVIQLDENCTGPLKVGSMKIGTGYDRDSMTFHISEGDPDHLFSLDSISGDLYLDPSSTIDFEGVSAYELIVEAIPKDSGQVFKDIALVTIRVNNLNDNPPVIHDTTFCLDESNDPEQLVTQYIGNLESFDPDGDLDPLSHAIASGDDQGNFYLNPSSAALYVWYNTVDYENQDSYSLVIDVTDGLFVSQALVTILVNDMLETAIDHADPDTEIQIYPNPVSDRLTIKFPDRQGKETRIEVRDAGGSLRISNPEIDAQAPGQICQLDLSSLEKGVFFISIRSKDFVTTRKIVKL